MSYECAIDTVLAPIATQVKTCANELLDIRDAASQRRQPGKCVACFYRVMGIAERQRVESSLDPLKTWIEQHLELVAEDDKQRELERMAIRLEGNDLEAYCRNVISLFHHDRGYMGNQISIRFAFKEIAA